MAIPKKRPIVYGRPYINVTAITLRASMIITIQTTLVNDNNVNWRGWNGQLNLH